MSPNYGPNPPSHDLIPDWFLGGDRKRRLLVALADAERTEPWTVSELTNAVRCGPATVYEVLRVLRSLDLLDRLPGGEYRFNAKPPLAVALRELLAALAPLAQHATPRPPRAGRRS